MSPLNRLKRLFEPPPGVQAARALFAAIVLRARDRRFFEEGGVADSFNGRFDLILLHLFLVLRRLKKEGAAGREFAQQLFDVAFANFDESLREMGVGDLSVGKKVRKMAEAFYGRLEAYETALDGPDPAMFEAALERNLYREVSATAAAVSFTASRARAFGESLEAFSFETLYAGQLPELGV